MNADELRKLPDRYPDGPSHATMDAFADAWQKDLDDWQDDADTLNSVGRMLDGATAQVTDLRQRLEAAEKACRMLAGTLSTFGRYSTMHPDEVLAEFAALAGKPAQQVAEADNAGQCSHCHKGRINHHGVCGFCGRPAA